KTRSARCGNGSGQRSRWARAWRTRPARRCSAATWSGGCTQARVKAAGGPREAGSGGPAGEASVREGGGGGGAGGEGGAGGGGGAAGRGGRSAGRLRRSSAVGMPASV